MWPRRRPRGHVWRGRRRVARGVHVAASAITLTAARVRGHHHTPRTSYSWRHVWGVWWVRWISSGSEGRGGGHPHSSLLCLLLRLLLRGLGLGGAGGMLGRC